MGVAHAAEGRARFHSRRVAGIGLAVAMALLARPAGAIEVDLELVADGLTQPVVLSSPPGDERRFIVEQPGRIRILTAEGELLEEPFLDIADRLVELQPNFDERGFLGLAFHPDFAANGRFYVYYSAPLRPGAPDPEWDHTARVSEFRVSWDDPNRADPASERIVLEIDQPQFDHNGGALAFGPDGHLYVALGDGGEAGDKGYGHAPEGNGQATDRLLGKILRLDVSGYPYRIPPDNPFVDDVHYRPEIWALGLRNPFRCTFDAAGDGRLFCGDVGQGSWEEINLIEKGGNYGWRIKEGRHCFDPETLRAEAAGCDADGLIDPIVAYGNCLEIEEGCEGRSVAGGYFYRGSAIPELQGRYLFGDWSASPDGLGPSIFLATPPADGGAIWPHEPLEIANVSFESWLLAVGQDGEHELYVLATDAVGPDPAETGGKVYKIVPAP